MALIEHNFTANGDSPVVKYSGGRANQGTIKLGAGQAFATGGKVNLHYSETQTGTFVVVENTTLDDSNKTTKNFELPSGFIKAVLSDVTAGSPNVDVIVQPH